MKVKGLWNHGYLHDPTHPKAAAEANTKRGVPKM